MRLPNITYVGDVSRYIEAGDNHLAAISFYKDIDYFRDDSLYVKFVKEVERAVRTDPDYTSFISYIRSVLGINFDQVMPQIVDTMGERSLLEAHHGPIFTLYDVCSVMLNWHIKYNHPITTFNVADKVLDEHYALRVQVIMLTKTNHEAMHEREIFAHVSQGIGNLNAFLKLYHDCLDDDQKYKIHNYLRLCVDNPSHDQGILDASVVKMIKV
jgi:hypothetical protein